MYQPQPVRRVYIPKPDGRKRPLGIPVVRDRVVQAAMKIVIEPLFEADFQLCHMQDIFAEAGITINPGNKKQIDQAIHRIVNVSYKNCPATWKEIKAGTANADKRKEFVQKLKNALPNK